MNTLGLREGMGLVQGHPAWGRVGGQIGLTPVPRLSPHHLFIHPLIHSPNMHSMLGAGDRTESMTDSPVLTPRMGGQGSEKKVIRQDGPCSDGGSSRGQGRDFDLSSRN